MENIKNEQTLWMEDSKLKDIPKHKLEFLQIMVFESKNLKQELYLCTQTKNIIYGIGDKVLLKAAKM